MSKRVKKIHDNRPRPTKGREPRDDYEDDSDLDPMTDDKCAVCPGLSSPAQDRPEP